MAFSKKTQRNLAVFNREKAKRPLYSAKRVFLGTEDKTTLYLKAYKEVKNV